jgi:3',5'-cyclic AMP phosphodiesterase CpdA
MKVARVRRTGRTGAALGALVGIAVSVACGPAPEGPGQVRINKGPYLQDVTPTAITVMWETSAPAPGRVLFGAGEQLTGEVVEIESATIHELRLAGLEPATEYRYRVESGPATSGVSSFTTAPPADGTPFRFATYGDNKDGPAVHERVADGVLAAGPEFVIHNGDLVNNGLVAKQWDRLFFNPTRRLMREVPLYPVLGNHEEHAPLFYDYFSLPGNETWYSFDYGNAHVVILDSDPAQLAEASGQLAWLEDDLTATDATWKVVSFHHPPFTASRDYYSVDRLERKRLLHPIFQRHRVDLVVSGHDHNYERTLPIGSDASEHAVTYLIAGNGGTPMHWSAVREWTAHSARTFGFVTVDVDGSRAHLRAYDVTGSVFDELVIDKGDEAAYTAYLDGAVDAEAVEDPVEVSTRYGHGDDLLEDEEYEAALGELTAAFEADSRCVRAASKAAECLIALGRPEEAVGWAIRAIDSVPQAPDGYEVLVEALRETGDDDAALEWAARWAAVAPDAPEPYVEMAGVHERRGDLGAALAALATAVEVLPSDAELHFELARLHQAAGARDSALAASARGVFWYMDEEDPTDPSYQRFVAARDETVAALQE